MTKLRLLSCALLVLAGCDTSARTLARLVDPPVAELALVQGLDRPAAAAHRPECALGTEGCAQVYVITGDACLRLAQQRLATGTAAPQAACAVARFDSLRNAGIFDTALRRLEAERLVRESGSGEAARMANARMANLASGVSEPAAGYYSASAVDWTATFAGPVACADLRQSAAEAGRAASAAPREGLDNRAAAAALARRLTQQADGRGCN